MRNIFCISLIMRSFQIKQPEALILDDAKCDKRCLGTNLQLADNCRDSSAGATFASDDLLDALSGSASAVIGRPAS